MKSLNRKTLTVILIFVIVTAFAAAARIYSGGSYSSAVLAGNIMKPWIPESAASVEISWLERKVTLQFKNGNWHLKERNDAQAATTEVATLLQQVSSLRPLKEVAFSGDADLRMMNLLDKPMKGYGNSGVGVSLKVKDGQGNLLADMVLGKGHVRIDPERIGQYRLQSYDGRYILVHQPNGERHAYLVARVFERCHPTIGFWLDQLAMRDLERPRYFRYSRQNSSGVFESVWWVSAAPNGFMLTCPAGEKLSLPKLSEKLKLLTAPFSFDLAPAGADLPPNAFKDRFQAVLSNGVTYLLELASVNGRVYAKMTVDFSLKHVSRAVGESESDFAIRRKNTQLRAEFEKKSWNGKIFMVKKDLIEQLSPVPVQQ